MRTKRMTAAKVHNKNTGTFYTITDPEQARDKTDKSAAKLAWDLGDVITLGETIVEPVWAHTDNS